MAMPLRQTAMKLPTRGVSVMGVVCCVAAWCGVAAVAAAEGFVPADPFSAGDGEYATRSPFLDRVRAAHDQRTAAEEGHLSEDEPPEALTSPQGFQQWLDFKEEGGMGTGVEELHAERSGAKLRYQLAFPSPVMVLNLKDALEEMGLQQSGELTLEALNERLVEHAMAVRHQILEDAGEDPIPGPGKDKSALETMVFDAYKQYWPEIAYSSPQSAALRVLVRVFKSSIQQYFRMFGLPEQAGEKEPEFKDMHLRVWQSVHYGNSQHKWHDHPGARTCGIYYARTPEGAGDLVFGDPRGQRAPFMYNPVTIKPQAGDIVIFPSWLPHAVEPTTAPINEARVSFSFNEAPIDDSSEGKPDWTFMGVEGAVHSDSPTARANPREHAKWTYNECAHCDWKSVSRTEASEDAMLEPGDDVEL